LQARKTSQFSQQLQIIDLHTTEKFIIFSKRVK